MEWFILSRDLHVLCVPSSEAQDSLPIFDDKQTIVLQNNTVVSTYDFSVQQKHPDATNLKWGNYVAFRDKYGKTRMYTLISHDGDDLVQTWHAEDIGLDLLNETADKWDYTGESHGIDWYFNNLVLKDTGWSIGINEIGNLTRGLKFDGQSDTQLKRLGDIANQFDGAEIDFEVELDGSRITKQVINIYRKVGNSMTQQRFIDAVNLKSLQSSGSIEDLCTAMIGYGSQPDIKDGENAEDVPPIDFADLSYDDGQFFSPKGDKAVYDRLNHLVWSRYSGFDTTNQNETKGYITGIYNYETKDPNELLNRTITQLKKRNAPSETYEANLLDINADIGDEVQIAHNNYNPPIYLSARVESVTNCYTASGQDTGILGDYQKLESQIDPRIKEMIDQLADQIKPNYTWIRYAKDNKGTGMTATPTTDTKYVAIVSNKPTGVPSDNPADYAGHWQLIKGNDGKDGIPGTTGADGKTSYTHFAYANNVSGTKDFSTDDPTGRSYMGVYSDFTQADSTDPTKYSWVELVGALSSGGRNYIKGSDVPIHITGIWHTESNGVSVPSWYAQIPSLIGKADGDWVVSFDISGLEGHNPTLVTVGFSDPKSTANNRVMGDFTVSKTGRVVAKVNLDSINNDWTSVLIYSNSGSWAGSQNKKADISRYQIEKGNIAGDWKQAPEDTQGQIDTINNGLADTNSKIAAVTKVDSQATAPTNPKKGDQWWVKDANGNINAFKIWDGTKWADSIIQQSAMNIDTLNGNTINGAVINGSKFTSNFSQEYTENNKSGQLFEGVQTIGGGMYTVDYKVKDAKAQHGYTHIRPDGIVSYITDEDGNIQDYGSLVKGSFNLMNKNASGYLFPEDLVRVGPEEWTNSDGQTEFTIRIELRWGRVWLSGVLLLPAAKFGTGGNGYRTIFNIKNTNLRPASTRWVKCSSFGDVPHSGLLEFRPNGDVVATGVPSQGRYSFEGESYVIENL